MFIFITFITYLFKPFNTNGYINKTKNRTKKRYTKKNTFLGLETCYPQVARLEPCCTHPFLVTSPDTSNVVVVCCVDVVGIAVGVWARFRITIYICSKTLVRIKKSEKKEKKERKKHLPSVVWARFRRRCPPCHIFHQLDLYK